ncbi:hypothetical protein GYMLUDRAFT_39930 [Collybiopsis luxurians FD-317 M1]|nr:hypothetical protein GYMLUDRAFT_39930 [Collybiopsis luxurians FD-317 M1]
MSLKLYQQHRSYDNVLNNTYCDENDKVIYTVHTPMAFLKHWTTTISRALYTESLPAPKNRISDDYPDSNLFRESQPPLVDDEDNVASLASGSQRRNFSVHETEGITTDDEGFPTPGLVTAATSPRRLSSRDHSNSNFEYIAQIDWRVFRSSKIRFSKGRFSGQEVLVSELFRKEGWGWLGRHRVFRGEDGKEYKWRLRNTHCELTLKDANNTPVATYHPELFSRRKPYLEIFPEGQHMMDELFATFTYIEHLRKVKERSAKN